jgi:tetratricopeptide (TPR) repeat protein
LVSSPRLWVLLALAALTVVVYAPVRHYDFVSVDDPVYVSENPVVARGLSWPGVAWAFTSSQAANWHPLTWLSHMLDVQLFGMAPGAHHVTNLVLHVLNTLLLYLLLLRMTGRAGPSAVVAALFAVHPLHVESVAWIAERKDVLSTLFWMLAVWAYLSYVGLPAFRRGAAAATEGRRRRWSYALMLLWFALGLMAKPMLVTLPFVLLVLDVWPLGRFGRPVAACDVRHAAGIRAWRSLVIEKVPLLALAAASSTITFLVQQRGGAVSGLAVVPLARRLANAAVACATYPLKAIWPSGLSAFYPYPAATTVAEVAGAIALLLAVSILALRLSRSRPYLLAGWLWYLITIAPVIGIVQVGRQAMADRYTYVPIVGVFVAATWGACDALSRVPARRVVLPAAAAAIIALYAVAARAQTGWWADSALLWQRALAVNPDNYFALNSLGYLSSEAGRTDEAIRYFSASLRFAPDYPEAHNNLGLMRARQGRLDEAIAEYRQALALNPDLFPAHNGLGKALAGQGKFTEAIGEYRAALRLNPRLVDAHNNLGVALSAVGRTSEAAAQYREALGVQPGQPDVLTNLGVALAALGESEEAMARLAEAVRLKPGVGAYHYNLATVLAGQGRTPDAVAEFTEALRLQPDLAAGHTGLALALTTQGRLAEALPHFAEAVRLQPSSDTAHQYLGIALAAAGRFQEAVAELDEALRLNPNSEVARRALAMAASHLRTSPGPGR